MSVRNVLYKKQYPVNEHISVVIPTVGEILDNENSYYNMISLITATPYDMMVQLDDMGIDFTKINDYELFLLTFNMMKSQDTSMVFGALDITRFVTTINQENNTVILRDEENSLVIDRAVHSQICDAVRKIHHLERNSRKPANGEAKKYMIQRAKEKMKRRQGRVEESQLEELIISLVNTEQFNYGFEGIQELSIYQFNESVHQIIKKIDFDNKMHGIYAGTISAKDMSQQDLNWLTHK
jgi:hypothetical protein